MSARAAALALGAFLLLQAGEAAAQTAVCSDTPAMGERISCEVASGVTQDITIDAANPSISTTDDNAFGVHALHQGVGSVSVKVRNGAIMTTGWQGYGVHVDHRSASGPISIGLNGGSIGTTGISGYGVLGLHAGAAGRVSIDLNDVAVTTAGARAFGVWGWAISAENEEVVSIGVQGGSVTTQGERSVGVYAYQNGSSGRISIDLNDVAVKTGGTRATGVYGYHSGAGGSVSIDLNNAAVTTTRWQSHGVSGWARSVSGEVDVSIDVQGGSIGTAGNQAYGVFGLHSGAGGSVSIKMSDADITAAGDSAVGLLGYTQNTANEGDVSIRASGGSVSAEGGQYARGLYGAHLGLGSVSMTTTAETSIKAPFFIGADGRLTNDENAAGRILITSGGTIEAREVGVRAWAIRSSGSTFGEGTRTADDAARTAPMIHVASSGDVTVGQSVMDDFIRGRIAGEDETLSAGEQAVLSAITAGDSDALDAALGALPASYDDDWKAQARELLRKRGWTPTDAAGLAGLAAYEILGLSRAGVHAMAISHITIADYVRRGDRDPAILAIYVSARTEEQAAALAEQEFLSAAERTVLEAVLTGGDLETALAALPAAYTDDWKDGVRLLAASYNAGNIRVDVTGGTIAAEGNGVEALYAVPRERNGAIAVSVAEGAEVTGGAAGIYVAGAGEDLRIEKRYAPRAVQEANAALGPDDMVAVEGYLNQVVRVEGVVTGGADAAVHLDGGGALIVTGAGRLLAGSSGRAVLVNDPGPAIIYVEGEVKGGAGAPAAVHLTGGGTVTVALAGSVDANGAALAIRGDAPTMVVIHVSGERLTREAAREAIVRVKGGIGGEGVGEVSLVLALTRDGFTTGQVQDVPLDAEGAPVLDDLPPDRFDCGRAEDGRCELYEALPSLLLAMSRTPSFAERMAAPRGARGGWGRIETSRGEWTADKADSIRNLAYDYRITGGRAGFDFDSGMGPRLGFSVHMLRGEAKMSGVGEINLNGAGAGVSATWTLGDFYLDAQAQFTQIDADIDSAMSGGLKKDVSGLGLSLGVEAGRRVALGEDMFITPRLGLARTSAELGDFTDSVGDPPARVSVEDARSVKGRLGVTVDKPMADGGRLFGTIDLEREFVDETRVKASDEKLDAEGPSTTIALGAGGAFSLSEGVTLTLSGRYETSGNAKEYGAAASLRVRF